MVGRVSIRVKGLADSFVTGVTQDLTRRSFTPSLPCPQRHSRLKSHVTNFRPEILGVRGGVAGCAHGDVNGAVGEGERHTFGGGPGSGKLGARGGEVVVHGLVG